MRIRKNIVMKNQINQITGKTKSWIYICIPIMVFFASVAVFFFLLNYQKKGTVASLEKPTLPLVYAVSEMGDINQMQGYTTEMKVTSMRDTITPFSTDKDVKLRIAGYGEDVRKAVFSITNINGRRIIQENVSADLKRLDSGYEVTLPISRELVTGTDYNLILKLELGERTVYYYTRLANFSDANVYKCVEFAKKLHQATFSIKATGTVRRYMETSAKDKSTNLNSIDIKSGLSKIMQVKFGGKVVGNPHTSILEMTNSYTSVKYEYVLSRNEKGVPTYYNVTEFYRIRYSGKKFYLVDFTRKTNRIFRGGELSKATDIVLGIRSKEVEYKTNESGSLVGFVQEGDLWSYDKSANEYHRIYGYHDLREVNERCNNTHHRIKLIRMTESGAIDFVVYGYFARGDHEGKVGIAVCHYDKLRDRVTETMFVPLTLSYEQLNVELGTYVYTAGNQVFYFSIGSKVFVVKRGDDAPKVLIESLGRNYKISPNGKYIAWEDQKERMCFLDCESGKTTILKGKNILAIGFVENDFVYGTGDHRGKYSKMIIYDIATQKIEKIYKKKYFSTGTVSKTGTITLKGIGSADFSVKNRDVASTQRVEVTTVTDKIKGTETILRLTSKAKKGKPNIRFAKIETSGKNTTFHVTDALFSSRYYIYARGEVTDTGRSIARAVRYADHYGGVVIDADQEYAWSRAKLLTQNKIVIQKSGGSSLQAKSVNLMLTAMGITPGNTDEQLKKGMTPIQILENSVEKGYVFDLTGCNLEAVFYYIGRGYPAYSVLDKEPVLLVGYSGSSVTYYRASTKKFTTVSIEKGKKLFQQSGSVFYVYLRT